MSRNIQENLINFDKISEIKNNKSKNRSELEYSGENKIAENGSGFLETGGVFSRTNSNIISSLCEPYPANKMTANDKTQEFHRNQKERQAFDNLPQNYFYNPALPSALNQLTALVNATSCSNVNSSTAIIPVKYNSCNEEMFNDRHRRPANRNEKVTCQQNNEVTNPIIETSLTFGSSAVHNDQYSNLRNHASIYNKMAIARNEADLQARGNHVQNPEFFNTEMTSKSSVYNFDPNSAVSFMPSGISIEATRSASNEHSRQQRNFNTVEQGFISRTQQIFTNPGLSSTEISTNRMSNKVHRSSDIQILNVENLGNFLHVESNQMNNHDSIVKFLHYQNMRTARQIDARKSNNQEVKNPQSTPFAAQSILASSTSTALHRPLSYNTLTPAPSPFIPICASTPFYSGPATPRIFPNSHGFNYGQSQAIEASKHKIGPNTQNYSISTSCGSGSIQSQSRPVIKQSVLNYASNSLGLSSASSQAVQNDSSTVPILTSKQVESQSTAVRLSRYSVPSSNTQYQPSSISAYQNINSSAESTLSNPSGQSKDDNFGPSSSSSDQTNRHISNSNTIRSSTSPAHSIISLSSDSSNVNTLISKFCQKCQRNFKTSYILDRHDCSLVCGFCKTAFDTRRKMLSHMRKAHLNALWRIHDRCDICGNTYRLSSYVCAHKKVGFKVPICKIYICDFDGQLFHCKKQLDGHMSRHLSKVKCDICHAELRRSSMKTHLREFHADERKFVCGICGNAFKFASVLREHLNRHDKKHECKVCGRKFPNRSNLMKHHRFKHGDNTEGVICRVCDKKISTKEKLKKHLRIHDKSMPKKFKCQRCGYSTDCKHRIRKHENSHKLKDEMYAAIENPFKCQKCEAHLKTKQALKCHMSNVHPSAHFECDLCARVIRVKSNLLKHMKIHIKHNKLRIIDGQGIGD